MITTRRRRLLAGSLAVAFVIAGCSRGGGDDSSSTTLPPQVSTSDEPIVSVDGRSIETSATPTAELGIRIGEGAAGETASDAVELTAGEPLSDDEIEDLLGRLPDWDPPDPDEATEFNPPTETELPPEPGTAVDVPFPPDGDDPPPATGPDGPLEVLRYQPEGDVELAPFVTATFSEPMVDVATLDDLDAAHVPMTISPAVEGRWRWLGTRTLRFEVVPGVLDRLPAATSYDVVVPAGTRSANDAVLPADVRWSFTTPTPTLLEMTGVGDSMPTDPVWVATFDQRVDPAAVLDTITVTVDRNDTPIRLATPADLDRDDEAGRAHESALDGRSVAFVPSSALPVDAAVVIEVGPEVPSAEGPLTSSDVERFRGRTFGALRITDTSCGWSDECVPGAPFRIEFSNRLDPDEFSADLIDVSPAIPGLHIDVRRSTVELRGATAGRTAYAVTFDGDLVDVFGQRLGDDATVTFDVGEAHPAMYGPSQWFITTDPTAERPSVPIMTINHDAVRVRAWAVTPAELTEFREYLDDARRDTDVPDPDWSVLMDDEVEIDHVTDTYVETAIDLASALESAGGEIVLRIDPLIDLNRDEYTFWDNRPTISWVQQTTLGVDAIFDDDKLVIATNDLVTGAPVPGVPVELLGDGRVATTDDDGLVELRLSDTEITGLFASVGGRSALLPADLWGGWTRSDTSDESRWFVFDDRGVYRPGETAHLTGWVRRFEWGDGARLELYDDDVTYHVSDSQGVDIDSGTLELSRLGGFSTDVELPSGVNLGAVQVTFELDGDPDDTEGSTSHGHSFQVQEFRRPEFEVDVRTVTAAPHYSSESATIAVDAAYFSGAPLADADVTWLVSTRESTYAPPNWRDYTFGVWQPWWFFDDADTGWWPVDDATYEEYSGRTDADGSHYLQVDFDGRDVDLPSVVAAEATVFDINRQGWSSRTDLLVHSAESYVGLRSDRHFVRPGDPIQIDAVVTDIDGELTPGLDVEITAGRVEWGLGDGTWTEEIVDPETCGFISTDSTDDMSMRCEFDTEIGGTYRITAIVTDDAGRSNRTEITQWVSGGRGVRPVSGIEQEEMTLVPDHDSYEPGDTAELLVQAPFAPAYGVVTVIHHGIVRSFAVEAEDGSAIVDIPIEDAFAPSVTVQVDMNGSAPRTDGAGTVRDDLPPRTAYATGQVTLQVPPVRRALDVAVDPEHPALEPGEQTSVTVAVTDADGNAVGNAEVAVVVVDEAVLSLTGYELADPLDAFYRELWSSVRSRYLRSTVLLTADGIEPLEPPGDDDLGEADEAAAAEDGGLEAGAAPETIALRADFDPVALYTPSETTGDDGTVTVQVDLPDNLTRYRVMAVAVAGAEQFGTGESSITARLPLMVRPSAPRFLNYGDRFELPVVLQNQTDEPLDVDVAVQTSNLSLPDGAGRRVTVPANDRVEVRFPGRTVSAGTARVRIAAASGSFADAASFNLPVNTPATSEAFATYGIIDDGAIVQPLTSPSDVIPRFGGLEIGSASTALQSLTDAVIYLVEYPWTSSDGYASRILAIASLGDVLDAFDAEGLPRPDDLDAQVASDITRLTALQNDDGGFPYWQRGSPSLPWTSVQATHALVVARDAGASVPAARLDDALSYLADVERHFPSHYSDELRASLSAYALYVRDLAGDTDTAKAEALYRREGEELDLDAVAWLWPSIRDEELRTAIERRITNSAVDTAGATTFATDYAEDSYVIAQSDTRTDAIVLDALLTQTPDSELIPRAVAGLDGRRHNGRWRNSQENSFVTLAMRRYFDTFEADDPEFIARAWIGDTYVSESPPLDRTTTRANTVVPMSDLIRLTTAPDEDDDGDGDDGDGDDGDGDDGDADEFDPSLVISKDGDGRLYYRVGLTYAPSDLRLDARDEGFVVERSYEAVGDDADVTLAEDGEWQIAAGATVRVRVTMIADAARAHVALVDHLPAGLEPINPDLVVSQTLPPDDEGDDTPRPFWWWPWFEHQNLRDDRAEAFASYLDGGVYEYTYLARATTPGTFVTPPATAEEIYAPETFGRTATDVVVIR